MTGLKINLKRERSKSTKVPRSKPSTGLGVLSNEETGKIIYEKLLLRKNFQIWKID